MLTESCPAHSSGFPPHEATARFAPPKPHAQQTFPELIYFCLWFSITGLFLIPLRQSLFNDLHLRLPQIPFEGSVYGMLWPNMDLNIGLTMINKSVYPEGPVKHLTLLSTWVFWYKKALFKSKPVIIMIVNGSKSFSEQVPSGQNEDRIPLCLYIHTTIKPPLLSQDMAQSRGP